MITMNGTITFYLRNAFPFTAEYEATIDSGEIVEIIENVTHSSIDYLDCGMEWEFQLALEQAVALDIKNQLDYTGCDELV